MVLNYFVWGDAAGRPIVMLHGFMGSGADWAAVAERIGGYVIAPDLPGHGASLRDDSAEFTMPAAANSIIALLDQLNISHCILLGYSMGGRLALYLATHYPDRFTKLILESSSPGIDNSAERSARKTWDTQIAQSLISQSLIAFLSDWYAMPLFNTFRQHPDYAQAFARRMQNDPQQLALSMQMMGTGSQPSLWDAWARLSVETLLVVGELDTKYVGISADMQQRNPSAQRVVLSGLGHNTHFEDADRFANAVSGFIAGT